MKARLRRAHYVLAAVAVISCGGSGPTSPTLGPLPVSNETLNFRYHYSPQDTVDANWQETYHTWAVARLGVSVPQKIDYYKYRSRQDMGDHTGHFNTNGFATPERFEIHTLWPTDNHEVVHIYTALVGRPSDFFNEGIAVAFQTNPAANDFESVFNGQQVHQACGQYLQLGQLVIPLDRIVQTNDFRAVSDATLSYRQAGSFVRFVIDRHGIARTLEFFRTSSRTDGLATIKNRFLVAFGEALESTEAEWMTMLRSVR
jgi:hypothetical protein